MRVQKYKSRTELAVVLLLLFAAIFLAIYSFLAPELSRHSSLQDEFAQKEAQIKEADTRDGADVDISMKQQDIEIYLRDLYSSIQIVEFVQNDNDKIEFTLQLELSAPADFYALVDSLKDAPWSIELKRSVEFKSEGNTLVGNALFSVN